MNEAIMHPGDAPVLMGIVNVTPDSFSDGGRFVDPAKAIEHGLRLVAEGAVILDIGGESTRPGADPVSMEEEQARVIPVLEGLKNSGAVLSIDTRNAATMRAALKAGSGMVNDISALTHDPDSLRLVADSDCLVCLMHMQGGPKTMQEEHQRVYRGECRPHGRTVGSSARDFRVRLPGRPMLDRHGPGLTAR